ncbi:rho GTPase-activating protein gacT-like [Drosophila miranda]|uniref:rho GTPase-activating protein gacT-like n=1 Tax=Drosophila miranda TaxID=7229 RepID=UPI00143FA92C|nr:rho GTPase-activating protein gacT-like [Drosophila miranda]
MDNLENELKMMKNLGSFPMQIPPLSMFQGACNISPSASTPTNPQSNQNQNDVDVDAGSTPRPQHPDSDGFSSSHHRTPPSPPPISPGQDYGGMFGSGNGAGGPGSNSTPVGSSSAGGGGGGGGAGGGANSMSASSPLPALQPQRRNASSVGSTYPEHELISPASSPSIPRYNFNGDMMRHKRAVQEQDQHEQRQRHNLSRHNQMSSDEENSIMPQNRYRTFLYVSIYRFAAAAAAASAANDLSDLQGLDMSSRSNASSNYHHNFQLPSSRYHHHIYDILSDREQSQQAQAQAQAQQATGASVVHQQEHGHGSQLAMQQHQSAAAMHNMLSEQLGEQEHDQTTSVDRDHGP